MADTDYAALVKTWGELRDSAIWASVIIGVIVAICFIIYYIIQYKKSKIAQDAKNNRASQIATSNDELKASVTELINTVKAHAKNEEEVVWPSVEGLKNNVQELTYRVNGTIDTRDSLNIIRLVFLKGVYYEARDILNEFLSIKEVDFKVREQYIKNKIRTNIGEVLTKYKATSADFKLSFNSNLFFKLDSTEIERFILVDIIWSETREYFLSQLKYEQKLEECSLKLFNIIKDYVNTIISEFEEENLPATVAIEKKKDSATHDSFKPFDSKAYRTPAPFKMPNA
jgi:hypothetical protein